MNNENEVYALTSLLQNIAIPFGDKILNNSTTENIEDTLEEVFNKIEEITGSMNSQYNQIILYTLAAHLKQSNLNTYNLFLYTLYENDQTAIDEVDTEVNDILSYAK